jgi:hypothetical protein
VPNFCNNQNAIVITHSSAWFYCGWADINVERDNPWHCHTPAFLSGIFYLKNLGNPEDSGTEFHDPREPWAHASRMQCVPGVSGHMIIFPAWLYHRPMLDPKNVERRYTIACNISAAVK